MKINSSRASKIKKSRPAPAARPETIDQPAGFGSYVAGILKRNGLEDSAIREISAFFAMSSDEKLEAARKFIHAAIIDAESDPGLRVAIAYRASEHALPGYTTLDSAHLLEIDKLLKNVRAYLNDKSRRRPLNYLMLAAPGSGKSHFIKQLARKLKSDRVEAVSFNMTAVQLHEDMARPLDELRNLKINDNFPILFLDEFDTNQSNYATLLPLLWDGELQIGPRNLKIGKALIVLAGSKPNIPRIMKSSREMKIAKSPEKPQGKLVDLLSRINGGTIEIPGLEVVTGSQDRRVDKVCLAISLAKARFGSDLSAIPRVLLRFIAHTQFRFGVRSIAQLIDSIDIGACDGFSLTASKLGLPFNSDSNLSNSSLGMHLLSNDGPLAIVNCWKQFLETDCDVLITSPELFSVKFDPESGKPITYG